MKNLLVYLLSVLVLVMLPAARMFAFANGGDKSTDFFSGEIDSPYFSSNDSSEPSGNNRISQVRNVGTFSSVCLLGSINIVYTQGSRYSIKVVGKKDAVACVKTQVKNGKLSVYIDNDGIKFPFFSKDVDLSGLVVYVQSPTVKEFSVTGSGDLDVRDQLKVDELKTSVSGSGEVKLQKVVATKIKMSVTGSGTIYANDVRANGAEVSVTGSGDVKCKYIASYDVSVSVTGSGDVELAGKARKFSKRVTGSGDINVSKLMKM